MNNEEYNVWRNLYETKEVFEKYKEEAETLSNMISSGAYIRDPVENAMQIGRYLALTYIIEYKPENETNTRSRSQSTY